MMGASVAKPADIDRATACITEAFAADPVWSLALARDDGRTDHIASYWRFIVENAMPFGGVHQWNSGEAYSVWIPPGKDESSPEHEAATEAWINESLSTEGVTALYQLYERMEAFYEKVPKVHAYLEILATHPDHRGRGVGQALLAADLSEWDALGIPTCLESSNPANNHRYIRLGYQAVGDYSAVLNDARVTQMLRQPRSERASA
jgi:GNAT superfamily N-acetyltransferase